MGEHDRRFDKGLVFSAGIHGEHFWHWQGCPLFDVVHPAFPCRPRRHPSCQGALKAVLEGAVMACDTPEPCKIPACQKTDKRDLFSNSASDVLLCLLI